MHKCGICNQEVEKRPKITDDGRCSKCCERLEMEGKKKEEF